MKTEQQSSQHSQRSIRGGTSPRRLWLSGLLLAATAAGPSYAAVNEDEWYDPSDWFDGNNIEYDDTYDYDPYDYTYTSGYDYGYDWDYWDSYYDAYDWDDYDTYGTWDYNPYTSSYWDRYDWDDDITDDTVEGTVYSYSLWVPDRDQKAQNTSASNTSSSQSGSKSEQGKKNDISRLEGTIEGLKNVKLSRSSGAAGAFTLAKVKLENGQTTVVNLGRQSKLDDVKVQKGDKIKAIGRRGQIQGQAVFVAQKLRVNGKDIEANPAIRLKGDNKPGSQFVQSGQESNNNDGSSQTSAAKQRMSSAEEEISGKVANIQKLNETDKNANRTLVTLTLQSGKSETVDLGPGAAPEKIGLDEGDMVTVRGRRDQIQGRSVIVAELVKVNGNRMSGSSS